MDAIMAVVTALVFMGMVSAIIAACRGASVATAFFAGLLLGPLGLLVAFLATPKTIGKDSSNAV